MNLIGDWSVAVPEAKSERADNPSHVMRFEPGSLELILYTFYSV